MRALLARLAGWPGPMPWRRRRGRCRGPGYLPGEGAVDAARLRSRRRPAAAGADPVLPLDAARGRHAPIEALAAALEAEGSRPLPLFVPSLRDARRSRQVEPALAAARPGRDRDHDGVRGGGGAASLFDRLAPVFQVVPATTRREAWAGGQRGLAPADLAMHVVLPELDGRILAGAISFKQAGARRARSLQLQANRPEPDRVAQVARRIAALVRLQATPPAERRLAMLMPDYPAAAGRAGYAVGLDVPASVLAMLADLATRAMRSRACRRRRAALMRAARARGRRAGARRLSALSAGCPEAAVAAVAAAWGGPEDDAPCAGRSGSAPPLRQRAGRAGAPDRGRSADRRADYHDPTLPPRHALVAFGLWLREASAAMRWCTSARTARSNGCRGRPWR